MVKFCVYHGFGGDYSDSNMTNYFKMNNYCKYYGNTFIVMTTIVSDNREMLGYAEQFRHLANQIHGHICVMLECHLSLNYDIIKLIN